MSYRLTYLKFFITSGIIYTIGQILIDTVKPAPARILVLFVTLDVILTGLGIYEQVVWFGKAIATAPFIGFVYLGTLISKPNIKK